MKIRYLIRAL